MDDQEKRHIFDDPQNVKRAIHALYVICGLSLLADFLINRQGDAQGSDAQGRLLR